MIINNDYLIDPLIYCIYIFFKIDVREKKGVINIFLHVFYSYMSSSLDIFKWSNIKHSLLEISVPSNCFKNVCKQI